MEFHILILCHLSCVFIFFLKKVIKHLTKNFLQKVLKKILSGHISVSVVGNAGKLTYIDAACVVVLCAIEKIACFVGHLIYTSLLITFYIVFTQLQAICVIGMMNRTEEELVRKKVKLNHIRTILLQKYASYLGCK